MVKTQVIFQHTCISGSSTSFLRLSMKAHISHRLLCLYSDRVPCALAFLKETFDCSEYGNGSCPENERSLGTRAAMYSLMAGAIFITVFGNLAMIVSISYFKQLHTPTNFLILSMAVTDFLLGFTIMPYSMVRSVENCWYFGLTFCKIHYSFDLMLSITSIFHLCSVAIDRFYAICYPLRYSTKMTIPVIKRLLLLCWSVPGAFAFGWSSQRLMLME